MPDVFKKRWIDAESSLDVELNNSQQFNKFLGLKLENFVNEIPHFNQKELIFALHFNTGIPEY